jgi:hypothetical protein
MQRHAVVKILEEDTRFTFSFLLSVPPEGKERQFNLCRELTEPPLLFSERIGTNVAKILNKKKKKKGEEEDKPPLIGVEFLSSGTVLSLGRQTSHLVKSLQLCLVQIVKGAVSRDGFGFRFHVWLVLGLNTGRGRFLNVLLAPMIL